MSATAAVLQVGVDETTLRVMGRTLALGGLSLFVAGCAAVVYRWYTRDRLPGGLAMLLGVGSVGVYLNTASLFQQAVGGTEGLFTLGAVVTNVLILAVATAVTPLGRRLGDRLAVDIFAVSGAREVESEVGRLVRTVGRVTSVTLPEEVEDIEGYDPVDPSVKERVGGRTLLFPRRLTVPELRDRLRTRLTEDYDVGQVDVELDEDGTVTYLALGTRAAGIGATLGPGTVAVAVRADPPNSASPGDVVQVWTTPPAGEADGAGEAGPPEEAATDAPGGGESPAGAATRESPAASATGGSSAGGSPPTRVLTGELRAAAGDVVTLVVDEAEAAALEASRTYRLVTLPAEPRADKEFASLLRAADETMGVLTVGASSPLVGRAVGDVDATVVAVRPADGPVEALPSRSRELAAGDGLYVVARPETLRRLEEEATAPPADGDSTDTTV